MLISSMSINGPPIPAHKMADFRTVTRMLPPSHSSPLPQPSPSRRIPKSRQVSSRVSKTRAKRSISKETKRKANTPTGLESKSKNYEPIRPSPLRQATTFLDLEERRGSLQNSIHPSFQEILYEVILDGDSQNPIIGSYEYKSHLKTGSNNSSLNNASPIKISASVSGADVTSRNIINSTMLDGPYRQAQIKNNQATSLDTKSKIPGVSEENLLRYSRHSTQTISSTDKQNFQIKSSSTSDIEGHIFSSKDNTTARSNTIHRCSKVPSNRLEHNLSRQDRSTQDDMCFIDPSASDSSDELYDFDKNHQNRNYAKHIKNAAKSFVNLALSSSIRKTASMPFKSDKQNHNLQNSFSLSSSKLGKTADFRDSHLNHRITHLTEDRRHHKKTLNEQINSKDSLESGPDFNSHKFKPKKRHPESSYSREPNRSKRDWRLLETIDAKLGYNHLTKIAKLIYFENGIPPKKTLLPKGQLIPPSQLTSHEVSSDCPPKRHSFALTKTRASVNSLKSAADRPSIPLKSPARRLNSVVVSKQKSKPYDGPFVPESETEVQSKSSSTDTLDEFDSEAQVDIRTFLSQSGSNKMRKLSLSEALAAPTVELYGNKDTLHTDEVVPTSYPDKLRPVVSAFDKKVRILFGTVIPIDSSANTQRRNSITQPYCLGPRTSLTVIGSMGCTVLSGSLFKLGGNLQWQKREFRTDGFNLVCLSKEIIKLPSGSLYIGQPDYLNADWKSYFQPTNPPSPHITHPLVATPADSDASKMGFYQTPKWVIPIGDIINLNMLTRKGVRVPDSFVIHTRSRNYIVKAENSRELAAWLYILQRMIITFKDSRDLIPGLIPDSLSRCASASSLKSFPNSKGFKPLVNIPAADINSLPALSSHESAIFIKPSFDSQPVCRHPRKDRRPSSLFNRYDPSQPLDSNIPLSLQLQREIVHDWVNSLCTLKQIQ